MKNTTSKFLWGVFFLGFGLMWIGSNLGILREGAVKGLLISFILILFGVVIILKGRQEEKDQNNTIEDKSDESRAGEYTAKEEFYRESYSEEGFTEDVPPNSNAENVDMRSSRTGSGKKNYTSILSSHNVQCTEEFTGGEITAILGGIELDLRNAVITRDIVIDVICIMGSIDIFLPSGVQVSVSCVPIMGGVESRINGSANRKESIFTVYIRGTCLMGGIEIR
ncbi:LiaF domain-containing protein [Anaerocolumna xylanovorans]|uniref:Cell wall-active antibiotics response 4TMS YvqF n=1 Tax=Anaerocolumna xylanovorans DSM 12503 TaxID=1121345 RepID=A0A1M7YN74_9FIRM|nr:LiaF domain-containing protein [Anaerocolumna xylanovorans]SHO54072.1 Cell wall-active antibiotics response 4TMS YvqF [Anaerocolumna xylanovorans DSM 12503]